MDCCGGLKRNKSIKQEDISVENKELNTGMVLIPGGKYIVGTDDAIGYPVDHEGPPTEVETAGFYIDETSVTNREFEKFVLETAYVTEAEKLGTSFVFHLLAGDKADAMQVPGLGWWLDVAGASWRHPFGDERSYFDLMDHPVVQISYYDALMYCKWANKRLPTEVEWEIAARGHQTTRYPWGDELILDGKHYCNIWQGEFPHINTEEDGYLGTAPAKSFYRNAFGVYQMIGNVWELCANPARIPLNQIQTISLEKQLSYYDSWNDIAAKGGSFLCHASYCNRYRISARNGIDKTSASSNASFRCVRDIVS